MVKTREIPALTERDKKRFWDKVVKDTGSECWLWIGAISDGYGELNLRGKMYKAHRVAWKLFYGSIPPEKCVLHSCDNPPCVRDAHLFTGTQKENAADREKKGRGNQAKGNRNGARTSPEKLPRGEKHGKSKLSNSNVLKSLKRYLAGESQTSIAKSLNVSISTINRIVSGVTWAHLQK